MTDTSSPPIDPETAMFLYALGFEALTEFLCRDQGDRDRLAACLDRAAEALRERCAGKPKPDGWVRAVAVAEEQSRQLRFPQRKP